MSKGTISVGDDTPTGEPADGPKGPYITDKTDDETRAARRKKPPMPSRTETRITEESELASDNAADPRQR